MSNLCNLQLQQYSFLFIKTLHNDCSHIELEDVHLILCALNIFSILTSVELGHFFHLKCLGVPSLCNLLLQYCIHSFLFKLCILIVHILKMCTGDAGPEQSLFHSDRSSSTGGAAGLLVDGLSAV